MKQVYERSLHHLGRFGRRCAVVCCAVLGGLTLATPAGAGTEFKLIAGASTTVPLTGGGWRVIPAAPGSSTAATRVWLGRMADAALPGIEASETVTVAGRAGPLAARVAQRVLVADAAAVVVGCISSIVCGLAVGGALYVGYKFMDGYRCRLSATQLLECDPGVPPMNAQGWTCNGAPAGPYISPLECARASFTQYLKTAPGAVTIVDGPSCDASNYCQAHWNWTDTQGHVYGPSLWTTYPSPSGTVKVCPPSSGLTPVPGFDGKCPSAYVPASVDDVKQKVVAYPPAPGSAAEQQLVDGVRQAVESGAQVAPSTVGTSGPASQTGTPAQTTTTDGTGTKTQTQTPTYTYHYDGDTITYDTTITNTTINNDGTTSTSSTTDSGAPKPADEQKDPCTLHPERVGCMSLGQAPDDAVSKRTESLSFGSEDVVLPANCPADEVVSTSHGTMAFSYQKICGVAIKAQPWVRVAGAMTALLLVLAALRSV